MMSSTMWKMMSGHVIINSCKWEVFVMKSCCNHAEQTKNGGYVVHDAKCESHVGHRNATVDHHESQKSGSDSGDSLEDDEEGDCCHSTEPMGKESLHH